jgi:serine/threonine protein kinase
LHRLIGEDMLNKHEKIKLLKFDDLVASAKVIIRGYLDDEYLRPSLSEIMSGLPEAYRPMEITWKKKGPETPPPKVGRYGIEDEEDLSAWNKVADKFRKIGLVIVCQLGIGEFGRVYEAINLINPSWPEKVAVKVDRIYKKRKKEAIQVEDVIMKLSHALSNSPHVISIYDAGLLSKKYTYHVLQLVAEGETLDELLGIGGTEPTSRPAIFGEEDTLQKLRQKFLKPIGQRSRRKNHRFTRPLTLNETIDVVVSMLLWVEKVHSLGYSINDVKTGNVMINCRGQIKGIDLDFYQKAPSFPQAFMQDFFLLSWACLLIFVNAPRKDPLPAESLKEDFGIALQSGADFFRDALLREWKFTDLSSKDASPFLDCFTDIISRSRANIYGVNRDLFEQDINRLIYLKRLFFEREIVMTTPTLYNYALYRCDSITGFRKGF